MCFTPPTLLGDIVDLMFDAIEPRLDRGQIVARCGGFVQGCGA